MLEIGNNTLNVPICTQKDSIEIYCDELGKNVELPNEQHNYTIFNTKLVKQIIACKERSIPYIEKILQNTNDEKTIAEGLYTLDRMHDVGIRGIYKTYPTISRFNDTQSPVIQSLLAGIYRKTQLPEAFGPLCKMLIKDSIQPPPPFLDPTEEIGGAILEYLRNKSAKDIYNS